jgi:hypothetical protein
VGDLHEAERRWQEFTASARHQTDVVTNFWIHMNPTRLGLLIAADDREGARALVARQTQLCAEHPHYRFMQVARALCSAEAALYWEGGRDALQTVRAEARILARSLYLFVWASAALLRVRAELAAASEEVDPEQRARRVRRGVRGLRTLRLFRPQEPLRSVIITLEAAIAWLQQRPDVAARHLERALLAFESQGALLAAASTRYVLGLLRTGAEAERLKHDAAAVLRYERIVHLERWLNWWLPGFRELVSNHAV